MTKESPEQQAPVARVMRAFKRGGASAMGFR